MVTAVALLWTCLLAGGDSVEAQFLQVAPE